ncbi:LPS export ABC transporter permease LptF [Thalassobius sp. I31.1]|uniref:LPS export ABC transporter permease LptF n=1 Tax=Thalassobius sp. I31.1 TaxID=2109912 RepID=UPI000D1B3787|nr:LPS export ABC transporter permease LptF [Thalassobius sp. I31.1]
MARFDRYLISQLMVLFGFFSLVLVMVYWVNKAVGLFDQLIADGQSVTVFLEFSALTLPRVVQIVLPISAFIATVYTINRLSRESELVVVQATGFSSFRLARPVLAFGLTVAIFLSLLSHILVPAAARQLAEREAEIARNISARFFSDGSFLHPTDGLTLYIREIEPSGEMVDLFLSDQRNAARPTTYTARRALLLRSEEGPRLLMYDGMAQTLDRDANKLATTSFTDFTYDISALIGDFGNRKPAIGELTTGQLLRADPQLIAQTGSSPALFKAAAHGRIAEPFLAMVTALVGFSCLLLGGFSRFGIWRQIVFAVVLLVVIKALDNAVVDITRKESSLVALMYLPIVVGLAVSAVILWISEHPALFRRRRQEAS